MTTTPILPSGSPNKIQSKSSALKAEDFIKMMVTQLQNQDPTDPEKNSELLAQMSQIGQLQTATELQDSMKSLVLQNSLGAAGNLIGKMVQGPDAACRLTPWMMARLVRKTPAHAATLIRGMMGAGSSQ